MPPKWSASIYAFEVLPACIPETKTFQKALKLLFQLSSMRIPAQPLPFLKVQLCEGPGRTQMTKENEAGQYQHTPTYPFMPIVVLQKYVF